jgi:hypothetical protein
MLHDHVTHPLGSFGLAQGIESKPKLAVKQPRRSNEALHKQILMLFTNNTTYETDCYYGTMLSKSKKTKYYSVKLLFDYKKHLITSESLSFTKLSHALGVVKLLEHYIKDEKTEVEMLLEDGKNFEDIVVTKITDDDIRELEELLGINSFTDDNNKNTSSVF